MTEQLPSIFIELDEDIRELLSLVRLLKIDFRFSDVIDDEAVNRIEKSISLAQRIQANLYSLKREVREE
ncbi:protein D-63 [Stygiolobus sp. CP850M]|uniref:protein D-63 n=1 Tax=Stygiolobus sp. CP850M TaxID=3133134 RepID=UPI00307E591F